MGFCYPPSIMSNHIGDLFAEYLSFLYEKSKKEGRSFLVLLLTYFIPPILILIGVILIMEKISP